MLRHLLHRVHLHVARDDALGFAADLQRIDRGEKGSAFQPFANVAGVEVDHPGVLLVAVDHGRNASGAACCPGGPLTGPVARLRVHDILVRH